MEQLGRIRPKSDMRRVGFYALPVPIGHHAVDLSAVFGVDYIGACDVGKGNNAKLGIGKNLFKVDVGMAGVGSVEDVIKPTEKRRIGTVDKAVYSHRSKHDTEAGGSRRRSVRADVYL